MKLKITIYLFLSLLSLSVKAQENIKIPGFGEVPYIKNDHNFTVDLKEYGKFDFTGTLQPLSLSTKATIDQLVNFPGYETMKNLTLQKIEVEISGDGLSVAAQADTGEKLGPLFAALNITAPTIEIETKIGKGSFELEGELAFPEPIEMVHIDNPGTVLKYSSMRLSASAETGSLDLSVTMGLFIKPSDVDPELETYFTMGYNLITQEISGAGSYTSEWIDPFGINTYVKPNSIILNGGALEVGWIPGTPAPSKVGIAIDDATFFGKNFTTMLTVAPASKQIGFHASSTTEMTANNMTEMMRDGFGLNVPDIFPTCYTLNNPVIKFAPTELKVGELEMQKGFELSGHAEVCDLFTGPFMYYFDMESEFIMHMDFEVDAKKFIMNEARKVEVLKNLVEEIFRDFEVQHFYMDLKGSRNDMALAGETEIKFRLRNQSYEYSFAASLDAEQIAKNIVKKMMEKGGPGFEAIAGKIKQGVKEAGQLASSAISTTSNLAKKYVELGATKIHHGHLLDGGEKYCRRHCIPNRANHLVNQVLPATQRALKLFHDRIIDDLVKIQGETQQQTIQLREAIFQDEWSNLVRNTDSQWNAIIEDKEYVGYFAMQKWAEHGGHMFRGIIEARKKEYDAYKSKLYYNLISSTNAATAKQTDSTPYFRIKNKHKGGYINIEQGPIRSTAIGAGSWSSEWILERVAGTGFVRIKNRWKGTYLHIEHGKLEASAIHEGANSSQWEILKVEGTNYVRIKNRHQSDYYIHHEWDIVECATIRMEWHSAMWELDYQTVPTTMTVKYDAPNGCGTFYKDGGELKKHCGWSTNWHSVVMLGSIGNSSSEYKILFYDQNTGRGEIYKVDANGNMQLLMAHNGWLKWDKIYWKEGLINFEQTNGYWAKYKSGDDGSIILHSEKKQ